MRYIGLGVAALALILCGTGKPAAAQSAPSGSYQQTCRNIGVRNYTLYAECRDTSNNWQSTQLRDYDRCSGEIQNINGSLQCTGNGGYNNGGYANGGYGNGNYGRDRDRDRDRDYDHDGDNDRDRNGNWGYNRGGYGDNGIPYGSYSQTCQNIRVNGNRLEASCQKRNGKLKHTSLSNFQGCREIENDNGKLRCR